MRKTDKILRQFISAVLVIFVIPAFFVSAAAAGTGDPPSGPFEMFLEKAAGRYFTRRDEDTAVLELIPAFGELYGAVGFYMGESLYSYYAAELVPACLLCEQECPAQYSAQSVDFIIQFYSNMSNAGMYWDGLSQQRLTIIPDGLLLSHYAGTGDGLISKDMIMLTGSGKAPTLFPYTAEMAESLLEKERTAEIPEFLTGTFLTSGTADGTGISQQLFLDADGGMLLLRKTAGVPPLLLKGGYALSVNDDGSFSLCYLMSSPAAGTMPYSGCAVLRGSGDSLIAEESDDWNRLLTLTASRQAYQREQ